MHMCVCVYTLHEVDHMHSSQRRLRQAPGGLLVGSAPWVSCLLPVSATDAETTSSLRPLHIEKPRIPWAFLCELQGNKLRKEGVWDTVNRVFFNSRVVG